MRKIMHVFGLSTWVFHNAPIDNALIKLGYEVEWIQVATTQTLIITSKKDIPVNEVFSLGMLVQAMAYK